MTEIDGLMEIKGKLKMKNIIILFLLLTGFVYSQSATHFLLLLAEKRGVTSIDTIPTQFYFTDVVGAGLSSYNTGYVVLAGFDSAYASAGTDSFQVNYDGVLDVGSEMVYNGDTIYVSLVASGTQGTAVTSTLTVGGVSDEYSVTTRTLWYVDRDATGGADGTSWTDAEVSIADVFANAIAAGDTIYVSGGTDSTTYIDDNTKNRIISKSFISDVVIAPSWETGHNGEVYFVQDLSTVSHNFTIYNCSHIKLTGLNFYTTVTGADPGWGGLFINANTYITIDNCTIVSSGVVSAIYIGGREDIGSTYITVNNCTIEVIGNNEPYDQDNIFTEYGGGYTFTNNILKHGGYNDTPHNDFIQFVYPGGERENLQSVVANNFFYSTAYHNQAGGGAVFVSEAGDGRFLIYNNIIASYQAPAQAGILIAKHLTPTGTVSARIFNNTIISGAPTTYPIQIGIVTGQVVDTLIVKNNIVVNDSAQRAMIAIFYGSIRDIDSVDIDYNHYGRNGWTSAPYWRRYN